MSKIFLPAPPEGYWKTSCIRATDSNKTLLGCFVLAIFGLQHDIKPPRFGRVAVIDAQGILYSNMQDKDGKIHPNHCLGPVQDVIDNFRGLADHLKLSDADRVALFGELKKWIKHDARANQTNEERGLTTH